MSRSFTIAAALPALCLLALSACAPSGRMTRTTGGESALPPVPHVEGALNVEVTWPRAGAVRPDVDSTFVFGEVGTGDARLTINGHVVEVAPNGAFLAFLPVPEEGTYTFVARAGGQTDTELFAYATPPPPAPAVIAFAEPRLGIVTGSKDTLATGSESAHAAPTPGGDRRWFFPTGARLPITGRQGGYLRIQFTDDTIGWVDSSVVRLEGPLRRGSMPVRAVSMRPQAQWVDVQLPIGHAPFRIDPQSRTLGITVYGHSAPAVSTVQISDGLIQSAAWTSSSPDSARLDLRLADGLWGYKLFYNDLGDLVVRVRRPPAIDPAQPLRGLRVLVDPGHPPGGAVGPTGLMEADANLEISLRLADLLRQRGAEVLMTRTTAAPVVSATNTAEELWARLDTAVARNAELLISVHNNAFAEGVNPFENFGTETYYYHPFSEPLADALLTEILRVTGLPNKGAKQRSLALVRSSWMPSTLTESLFMMFPRQEAALRDPQFLDELAAAHLRGIERFLQRYLELSRE